MKKLIHFHFKDWKVKKIKYLNRLLYGVEFRVRFSVFADFLPFCMYSIYLNDTSNKWGEIWNLKKLTENY